MTRRDGRLAGDLRPMKIERRFTKHAPGSVLVHAGETRVLCTATLELGVPAWRAGTGSGWITAEYDMLPSATHTRRERNRTKIDGRTQEIQRLIGRSLRSITDLARLGEITIIIDCDVLQADGGTRTASITGGFIALADALAEGVKKKMIPPGCITSHVAAVSVGIIDGQLLLDLDYEEDVRAEVDLNIAMDEEGRLIEIQGTAEQARFSREQLDQLVELGARGVEDLITLQKRALNPQAVS